MSKPVALFYLALAFATPASVRAKVLDQMDERAKSGVEIFNQYCLKTEGKSDEALSTFGAGIPGANRLSDEAMRQAEGESGGIGWAIRAPGDALFMLEYSPKGICGVRLVEANERDVQALFALMVWNAAHTAGAELVQGKPEKHNQDGAKITFQPYSYRFSEGTAIVALSTSNKKVAAQQHYMTFRLAKS